MKKEIQIPQPLVPLFPIPVVLVTCGTLEKPNIITVGWIGVLCSSPPQIGIGIRPERYSYNLIEEHREFVVNIPTVNLLKQVELCGSVSGRDKDKFSLTGLTLTPSTKVEAPSIDDCPVNTECKVRNIFALGSHSLFVGEVISIRADEEIIDSSSKAKLDFSKLKLMSVNLSEYWALSQKIGNVVQISRGGL